MLVTEAEEFFNDGEARTPPAHKIIDRLSDVGLGYLSLGQPLTTLSGGERQRLGLATHKGEKGDVYILDELTTDSTSPTSSSRLACSTGSSTPASRSSSHAPPGGHGACRLDHRPRPRPRQRRRPDHFEGNTRRPRRRSLHLTGEHLGGLRRRLTEARDRQARRFSWSAIRRGKRPPTT